MRCFNCGHRGEMGTERRTFQSGAAKVTVPVKVCPECDKSVGL